jgi:hypothetical protein
MSTAGKKKAMQDISKDESSGLRMREVRLLIPDERHPEVIARTKAAIAALDPEDEREAMRWIEAVSIFNDDPDAE